MSWFRKSPKKAFGGPAPAQQPQQPAKPQPDAPKPKTK